MKKAFLTVLVIFSSLLLFSDEISKTFYFSDYTIEEVDGYQLVHFPNCMQTAVTGSPAMPWFAVKILLPPGEKAISFSVSGLQQQQLAGKYRLYPQQSSRPLSHGPSGEFRYNRKVYRSNNPYPAQPHGSISTEYMNGYSIALLNICPLNYIPASGTLSFYNEMTVTIQTAPDRRSQEALSLLNTSRNTIDKLNEFIQNPEMRQAYPQKDSRTDNYQYLIITPQAFENEFEDLQELYLYRGIESEVMTTEEIASTMSGADQQEKIRNYIIQEVQGHGVEFVLLGGDVEHVPYRGFYCYVESGAGYSDDNIPADLYYCALDGTWNDNGNNLWGEIDEDDLLPDVALGRFSFSTLSELEAMLHKTTAYQDLPIMGEFTNPLLAGEHLWNDPETWGSDYLRLLIGQHDDNGYTTIGIPPDHNIDSLYELYQNWGGSDIIAEINAGKSFVHHCGHANSSTVMHLSIPDITNSNFSQVNGISHNYTFVQSHGCICGAFDDSDCIMEHMVKIENFAAAVIGNSRYGWFNEGQTEGPSAHLHREMLDALYEEQLGRIGAAFVECKIQTAPWVNAPGQHEEGALRWNFYDINILGDPTLQLWTDEPFTPTALYTSPVQLGDNQIDVTAYNNGVLAEGLVCALVRDGIIHGVDTTDASGNATIIIDPPFTTPGTAELVISGYNCLTTSFNVIISPAGGPYIIYQDHMLDDTIGGNGNGKADFGESVLLTVELANAGTADANDVEATLSQGDQYLAVTDNFGEYGTIAAGAVSAPENEFAFTVGDSVPDQHVVDITMDIVGNSKENWAGSFSIVLQAPVLEAGNMNIDDMAYGNGNGFLDPGETVTLSFGVLNTGHSTAPMAESSLSSSSPWLTINSGTAMLGDLEPGINYYADFQVSLHEDTPLGTLIDLEFTCVSGAYSLSEPYTSTVGILVEDWETGGFDRFNWKFAEDKQWEISTTEPWEGTYCSRSGNISDNQASELFITFDVLADGDLSFYRKLSSEAEWDFLRFYIDYDMQGEWSGELDWEKVSFPVTQGLHTFRWVYEKDNYYSSGNDCAWVDYIVFPPVDITTGTTDKDIEEGLSFEVWPNPVHSQLNITFTNPGGETIQLSLYDQLGQEIYSMEEPGHAAAGRHHITANLSHLQGGVYIIRLIGESGVRTKKIVVE